MTYQVLARKWRPRVIDAVVGQEAVTRTLRNALAGGRVAHAYLFTGPRGVGKTTTARLLARALACTARSGPEACDACPSCAEVAAGTSVDVIEIDAASNNGVEEIRALRDNVKYAPARGRFKVYIVDEVHMLRGRRSTPSSRPSRSRRRTWCSSPPPPIRGRSPPPCSPAVSVSISSRCRCYEVPARNRGIGPGRHDE